MWWFSRRVLFRHLLMLPAGSESWTVEQFQISFRQFCHLTIETGEVRQFGIWSCIIPRIHCFVGYFFNAWLFISVLHRLRNMFFYHVNSALLDVLFRKLLAWLLFRFIIYCLAICDLYFVLFALRFCATKNDNISFRARDRTVSNVKLCHIKRCFTVCLCSQWRLTFRIVRGATQLLTTVTNASDEWRR